MSRRHEVAAGPKRGREARDQNSGTSRPLEVEHVCDDHAVKAGRRKLDFVVVAWERLGPVVKAQGDGAVTEGFEHVRQVEYHQLCIHTNCQHRERLRVRHYPPSNSLLLVLLSVLAGLWAFVYGAPN